MVAAHVGALVDGHGEVSSTKQRADVGFAGLDRRSHARSVEAGAGAHLVRAAEVHDQHAHRPVGLGLQDEASFELQGGAEQDRKRDRLAEQLGDRRRIIVA